MVGSLSEIDNLDTLRTRLNAVEQQLVLAEAEVKRARQESETVKFELSKKLSEAEIHLNLKETELRRLRNKYKPFDTEIQQTAQALVEERKNFGDLQKSKETVVEYLKGSFEAMRQMLENVVDSVTKSLHCLGFDD